jgi:1-acyl-sn-glycerol-3-phosphate acyltransferase
MIDRIVSRLMLSSLRRAFRRICWVGTAPEFPADRPIVLYANHHNFYDGYLLWLLSTRLLHRKPVTWMAEWDAFPFFGSVGAFPFPPGDNHRRLRTIRRTSRLLREDPHSLLFYFPERELHPPEDGIRPISSAAMARLERIFPPASWWPVALHMTSRGDSLPTLLMAGNAYHECIDGREEERLREQLGWLKASAHPCERVLLEGHSSASESWNMRWMRGWFERYV